MTLATGLAMDEHIIKSIRRKKRALGISDAIGAHPSGFNCPADADWRTVSNPRRMSASAAFTKRRASMNWRRASLDSLKANSPD